MKAIAIFNNKGGVGKTTFLCNLASFLCKQRQLKVLVIDADPQCNTTTYVLNDDQFLNIYINSRNFTISNIVPPLQEGAGYIQQYRVSTSTYFGFDLIPGHPQFAACEDFLASEWKDVKASELRGIKSTMLFVHFLSLCNNYDYVFFDMGPSLGAINRSILLACDFFITPLSSDVFSLLALGNIGDSIIGWSSSYNAAVAELDVNKRRGIAELKQECNLMFLGYVEQQYISKNIDGASRAVRAYDEILKKIPTEICEKIVKRINLKSVRTEINYKIGSVPNFYSLVPMSQTAHKPIFDLTNSDGVVGAHYQKVKDFFDLMKAITQRMLQNMEALIND